MKKKRKNMHLGASASTFNNAFNLRKKLTEAEKILWSRIKNRQIRNALPKAASDASFRGG